MWCDASIIAYSKLLWHSMHFPWINFRYASLYTVRQLQSKHRGVRSLTWQLFTSSSARWWHRTGLDKFRQIHDYFHLPKPNALYLHVTFCFVLFVCFSQGIVHSVACFVQMRDFSDKRAYFDWHQYNIFIWWKLCVFCSKQCIKTLARNALAQTVLLLALCKKAIWLVQPWKIATVLF